MIKTTRPLLLLAVSLLMPVSVLVFGGCSNNEETSGASSDSGGAMGGPGGRMGGPNGGGGPRFEPAAANATASEIFLQKCQGCHGDKGQGDKGPALTNVAHRSDAELHQIIHDGHEKMPSFANQMTKAQIDAVVSYIKKLNSTS